MQGTGARCVNSLATRVMLTLFPPNANNFKLAPDDVDLKDVAEGAGLMVGEVEQALSQIERTVINENETSVVRGPIAQGLEHFLAIGNVCVYIPDEGPAKIYPLTRYVVDRDGSGTILKIITMDSIAAATLPDNVRTAIGDKDKEAASTVSTDLDLYTCITRNGDTQKWDVFQEINGVVIPESEGSYPIDACPWIVAMLNPAEGEDYGCGLVWDYIGDFEHLEALRKAIRKGAAAAAKILWALDPNSPLREKQITEAASGDVLRMRASDLQAVTLDKYGDMNFVRQEAADLKEDLESVFGVRTSIQRNGERVTAEEIKYLAQELEESSAGLYSIASETLVLPIVRRQMDRLQRQGRLPDMPANIMKPRITVGLAAIGRGQDQRKLIEYAQISKEVLGEEEFKARMNTSEWLARFGAAADIDTTGLIKPDEQVDQESTNSAMTQGLVKAAPQIAGALAQPTQ